MKTVREAGETFSSASGHDSRFAPLGDSLVFVTRNTNWSCLRRRLGLTRVESIE